MMSPYQNSAGGGYRRALTDKLHSPGEPFQDPAAAGLQPPPVEPPAPAPAPAAAAPKGLGSFAGKLEGFDHGKLNSDHNSPKYQFGRVMSQFDPKGGVTPQMLEQLNALGLGTVSGQGDKIRIGGNIDPRFQGVTEFDVIRDLENGGGWQWDGGGGGAPQAAGRFNAGGLSSLLGGDPSANIQAALGGLGQSDFLSALLAKLRGQA